MSKQIDLALEKRGALYSEYRDVERNTALPAGEKRERLDQVRNEIEVADVTLRALAEDAETRAAESRAGNLIVPSAGGEARTSEDATYRGFLPSGNEFRALIAEGTPSAGGYAVSESVANAYIDTLRKTSTFLRAPGLNVIRTDTQKFNLPHLQSSTSPGVVAEGAAIPEAADTWSTVALDAIKFGDLRFASNEILADAAFPLRAAIGQTMVRQVAVAVDNSAFNGVGGATDLTGLAGQGTQTTLAVGNTVLEWDDIISALVDIQAAGAEPTVIFSAPDVSKALLQQKASTAGTYLAGDVSDDPARKALGLPIHTSAHVPAGKVIVADASRIWVGVRDDVSVAVSESAGFRNDTVGFRLTWRLGGVSVDTAAAVQVLTPSAT